MDVSQQAFDEARGRAFYREVEARVRALPGVESAQLRAIRSRSGTTTRARTSRPKASPSRRTSGSRGRLQRRRTGLLPDDEVADRPRPRVHARRRRARARRGDRQRAHGAAVLAGPGSHRQALPLTQPNRAVARGRRRVGTRQVSVHLRGSRRLLLHADRAAVPRAARAPHPHGGVTRSSRAGGTERDPRAQPRSAGLRRAVPGRMLQGPNGFFLLKMGALFGGALGALGLLLALVGIYGVVSYAAASERRRLASAWRSAPSGATSCASSSARASRSSAIGLGLGARALGISSAAGQPAVRDLVERSADLRPCRSSRLDGARRVVYAGAPRHAHRPDDRVAFRVEPRTTRLHGYGFTAWPRRRGRRRAAARGRDRLTSARPRSSTRSRAGAAHRSPNSDP